MLSFVRSFFMKLRVLKHTSLHNAFKEIQFNNGSIFVKSILNQGTSIKMNFPNN